MSVASQEGNHRRAAAKRDWDVRDAEHHAIARIGAAYERCLQAAERLERLVDEASVNGASPPVDALRADFDAQIAVTRSVRAFTALCPPDGPDLDDVPGAAFVLAMYHAGDALEAEELDGLAGAFDTWLAEVSRWTPAHIAMPPTRPVSPAHSHVLATVDQWWGYHHERLHDDISGDADHRRTGGVDRDRCGCGR